MFKRVNCGEILWGSSADVMGNMRRCGYVITLLLLLLQYPEKDLHVPIPAVHSNTNQKIFHSLYKKYTFIRFFFL